MARILMFGTYEADYDRNRVVRAALESAGHTVSQCHVPLWQGRHNKLDGSPLAYARLATHYARAYASLVANYPFGSEHDVVWVGYLGHLDVFVARALASLSGKPVLFDAFISLFDTLARDRGVVPEASLSAKLLKLVDRAACAVSDGVLVDTRGHADYFVQQLSVPRRKVDAVAVSADQQVFSPRPLSLKPRPFQVLMYAKFSPLHGLPTILEAARLLGEEGDIVFKLVGTGQSAGLIERAALANVQHVPWMEPTHLAQEMARSGVTLGVFGSSDKAARVVPNKVFQALSVGVPLVTADTPGVRALLEHERDALLVPAGDGRALADAIVRLRDGEALRQRLALGARRTFDQRCGLVQVAAQIDVALAKLTG